MFETKYGIEIEFTGITRSQAAKVAADVMHGRTCCAGNDWNDWNDWYAVDARGRKWQFVYDGSIVCPLAQVHPQLRKHHRQQERPLLQGDANSSEPSALLQEDGRVVGGQAEQGEAHNHRADCGYMVRRVRW